MGLRNKATDARGESTPKTAKNGLRAAAESARPEPPTPAPPDILMEETVPDESDHEEAGLNIFNVATSIAAATKESAPRKGLRAAAEGARSGTTAPAPPGVFVDDARTQEAAPRKGLRAAAESVRPETPAPPDILVEETVPDESDHEEVGLNIFNAAKTKESTPQKGLRAAAEAAISETPQTPPDIQVEETVPDKSNPEEAGLNMFNAAAGVAAETKKVAPARGLRAAAEGARPEPPTPTPPDILAEEPAHEESEREEVGLDAQGELTGDDYAESLLMDQMKELETEEPEFVPELPSVSADQLPELFGLETGGDTGIGERGDAHSVQIFSAMYDTSVPTEGEEAPAAYDKFVKRVTRLLRLFMMVPFIALGDRFKAQSAKYDDLRTQLQQARIPISYEMYLSNSMFYSIAAGLTGAILGLIASFMAVVVIGLPDQITKLTFSERTAWLLDFKEIFLSVFVVVFLSLVLGGIVYALFLTYPSIKAGERKTSINQNLPYAVTFMYALSNGGMNIVEIFRSLAGCEDTYGEVSKEVDMIVRDMDYFGHDLRTALRNVSHLTISSKFQDLTHNLLSVIDSGGDIPRYFKDKSEQYLKDAVIDQKAYLETLALIAESYVTAFVAGPLFMIIMGVMMVLMGSGNDVMLQALIYGVIPIGSVMFLFMINIISPTAGGVPKLLSTRTRLDHEIVIPPELANLKLEKNAPVDAAMEETLALKKRWEGFAKSKKTLAFREVLRDPLKSVKIQPAGILVASIPLALIFFAASYMTHKHELLNTSLIINFLDDTIVYSMFLALIPLAFFHEAKTMRENKLQRQIPGFLDKLASTNETGMTMRDSIKLMAKSDIGTLSKQIKLVWNDINWGLDVNDSMVRFANRIRTHVVSRSITLINKANESSGDIGGVLEVAARDAETEQTLKRERVINMMIYIIIIYISFLVFVGVIYVITDSFLTKMAEAGEQMAASGGNAGLLGAFDLDAYKRLFFHASLIQGFCSGLIAGVMGEGSVLSGLKHSIIMVTVALLIFKLLVGGV